MKWTLAAVLVAMTGCATDDPIEPESASTSAPLAIHLVECMPSMSVAGNGPYSVQCAVAYTVSEAGVQIAYDATDATGSLWVNARAAAPLATAPDEHGYTVFALESVTAPAVGNLQVHAKLVDDSHSVTSDEITATIVVSN